MLKAKCFAIGFIKVIGVLLLIIAGNAIGISIFNLAMWAAQNHPMLTVGVIMLTLAVIGTLAEGWKIYQTEVMKAHARGETLWE